MDRVKGIKLGSIVWGLILVVQAHAGPALEESYPESSFGVYKGFASRAVAGMEEPEEDNSLGFERVPAFRSLASTEPRAKAGGAETKDLPRPAAKHNPVTSEPSATSIEAEIARKGVQEIALIAGDLGYFPKTVFVTRDVPVRLYVTGASRNTLCIMMDSFQVRKQVRSQKIEEITFTPTVPGQYRFYCPVNGMEGTLVVREFTVTHPGNVTN